MKDIRLGIIGLGNMGSTHARNLLQGAVPGMVLSALCDKNADRLKPFPEVAHFSDANALITSPTVDAVLVATPHFDHTVYGIATLQAGKHLLVEKPISVHKQDCEKLIAAYTDKRLVFAAMFNQRTDPRYAKLKALIDSGELGQLRRATWNVTGWFRTESYYASGGWRATWKGEGGGVLLNQSPHQLDLWQHFFGMPTKVRAFVTLARYHDIEVEDDVTAYLENADGFRGVFITTTGEAPGSDRLEIAAERGRVVLDAEVDDIRWIRNETPMSAWSKTCPGGFTRPPRWEVIVPTGTDKDPQHVGIMRNFAAAIREGTPLTAPGVEGIRSVELANAMLYSGLKDETVELPLDSGRYAQFLDGLIAHSREKPHVARETSSPDDFSQSF